MRPLYVVVVGLMLPALTGCGVLSQPGPSVSVQEECVRSGGVWRATFCSREMGGGGSGGGGSGGM